MFGRELLRANAAPYDTESGVFGDMSHLDGLAASGQDAAARRMEEWVALPRRRSWPDTAEKIACLAPGCKRCTARRPSCRHRTSLPSLPTTRPQTLPSRLAVTAPSFLITEWRPLKIHRRGSAGSHHPRSHPAPVALSRDSIRFASRALHSDHRGALLQFWCASFRIATTGT